LFEQLEKERKTARKQGDTEKAKQLGKVTQSLYNILETTQTHPFAEYNYWAGFVCQGVD
jgi:hypothetical protein